MSSLNKNIINTANSVNKTAVNSDLNSRIRSTNSSRLNTEIHNSTSTTGADNNNNISSIKTTTKTTKYYSEDDNNSSDNYNRQKTLKLRHSSLPRTTLLYPILNRNTTTTTTTTNQQFYPTWDEWKERHKIINENKTPVPISIDSKITTASGNNINNETEITTTTTTTKTSRNMYEEEVYNKKKSKNMNSNNDNHSIIIDKQQQINEVENKEQNNNNNHREKLELINNNNNNQQNIISSSSSHYSSIDAYRNNKTKNLEDYINKNSKLIEDHELYYKNKEIEAKYLENQINNYMKNTLNQQHKKTKVNTSTSTTNNNNKDEQCFQQQQTESSSTSLLPLRKDYFETMIKTGGKIKGDDQNVRIKHSYSQSRASGNVDLDINNENNRLMLTSCVSAPIEIVEAKEIKGEERAQQKTTITSSTSKRNNSLTNHNYINNTTKSMRSTRLTESDSDTETQNRLLAKATGSIPIEYISIRRDPKPTEKQVNLKSASITTGTNTIVDRGKRIAATNTEEPEIPKYNLHLSLDSLIKRNEKREVSTSTERVKFLNKSAATETERKKDAYTLTSDGESDSEPIQIPIQEVKPPSPQLHQYSYRSRRARYEWETCSSPGIRDEYRLELLAKSPRTLRKRQHIQHHQTHSQSRKYAAYEDETDASDVEFSRQRSANNRNKFQEICIDDDDRLIFGESYMQQKHHHHHHHHEEHRSASLSRIPLRAVNDDLITTRRYIRKTKTYNPQVNEQIQSIGLADSADGFSSYFKEMHAKFNQVFSAKNQELNNVQTTTFYEPGGTNRYYKYTKTVTNDALPTILPSFGEIYRQNNNYNIASGYHQQQQQVQQVHRGGPIIETPNSTIKSTTINRTNSLNNRGPIITPLSPTSSDMNLATSLVKQSSGGSTLRSRKQKFSSSSSSSYRQAQYSSQQQQQQQQLSNINSSSYMYRVPVVNASNSEQYDTEKHFIPINVQEQKKFSSTYTDYGPNNYRGYQQQQTTIIS